MKYLLLKKKKNKHLGNMIAIDTLIGEYAKIDGDIALEGSIKIDGEIRGSVRSNSEIIIDRTAHVTGNLSAQSIYISGTVVGNILTHGCISISSTACIKGDVIAGSLIIDEGAEMAGTCQVRDTEKDGLQN